MRRALRALLVAVLPATLLVPAGTSEAVTLPTYCIPGDSSSQRCSWSKGRVSFVADGDTIDVVVGTTTHRIRITGINAMEMSVYSKYRDRRRGDCHAVEATNRLEDLINAAGGVVYLAAQDLGSKSGSRLRRSVWTNVNGVWRDLALTLLKEGRALALSNPVEWAHVEYGYWQQRAARAGVNLWDRDSCGSGPVQTARLSMWVNWDADGSDGQNLNGEWVRLRNWASTDVSLSGWWLRDTNTSRNYYFPAGTKIPAGKWITLHVGSGTNTATRFYWGLTGALFDNVDRAHGQGDGGYLFDPDGDLRLWSMWPCRTSCTDALAGKVDVRAHPTTPEYIDIKNVSTAPINLRGHLLKNPPYSYHFLYSTPVAPGKTLRVYVAGSSSNNTTTTKYWGKSGFILNDGGDVVSLRSYTDIVIDCHRWGSGPAC
jgi:endonuclease YncB( thermonuclease family)